MPCCSSCVADNNDALWLPQNSVRAIMAILIVIATFGTLSFLIIYLAMNQQQTISVSMMGIMSTALSSVVTTYFNTRSNQQATKQISDIQNQHIANLQSHNLQLLQVLSTNNIEVPQIVNDNIDHINDNHVIDISQN